MKTWIKVYTEILDDYKLAGESVELIGWWTLLLALAGKLDHRDEDECETGRLATLEAVAWHLRKTPEEITPIIARFTELHMIHEDDGVLYLTNYTKRQARRRSSRPSEVNRRVKEYRERKRQQECNADVTQTARECNAPRVEENRVDTEVEVDTECNAATAAVFDAWAKARGGAINSMDADQVGDLIDEYSAEWVIEAIKEANQSRQDKLPSLNFVRAILDRWRREGFKTPFDWRQKREEAQVEAAAQEEQDALQRKLDEYHKRWEKGNH